MGITGRFRQGGESGFQRSHQLGKRQTGNAFSLNLFRNVWHVDKPAPYPWGMKGTMVQYGVHKVVAHIGAGTVGKGGRYPRFSNMLRHGFYRQVGK